MLWAAIGVLLGALVYRARGMAAFKWPGRLACALLVSLPVLTAGLGSSWGFGPALAVVAYAVAAALSTLAVGLGHGRFIDLGERHGTLWSDVLGLSQTGLLFTMPSAMAVGLLGNWEAGALLMAAGLLKGPAYLLADRLDRRQEPTEQKYLLRELAFGACFGAAAGAAV